MEHATTIGNRPRRGRLASLAATVLVVATSLLGLVAANPSVAASPPQYTDSASVPVKPGGVATSTAPVALGADGNLWFGATNSTAIIRLTPGGIATAFTAGLTAGANFGGLTKGPDGNIWFTELNKSIVGKITPGGTVTEYPLPNAGTAPGGITAGPDGRLWFAERSRVGVGRMATNGTYSELTVGFHSGTWDVAAAPDGSVWSSGFDAKYLYRSTTAGVTTTFATARSGAAIVVASNGDVWMAESAVIGGTGGVERFSSNGVSQTFTSYTQDPTFPSKAVIGPDGDVWFSAVSWPDNDSTRARCEVGHVNRLTAATTFYDCGVGQNNGVLGIAVGADGDLWTGGIGSATSYRFTPPPDAPSSVSAIAGDAQVTLHWTAPPSDPVAPTTAFHVTPYANGVAQPVRNFDASTTTRTITGLTNGVSYTFRVTATNSIGTSDPSAASTAVMPRHTTDEEAFVRAAYQDFIARPPTGPELDTWVPYLRSGGSRGTLVTQLAASPEWVSAIVTRFYTDTLGRTPDAGGLAYWDRLITSKHMTVAQVASQLYASDEYFTHFGGGTPRTWVSDLYTKILRRSPLEDQAGVDYWVRMVASHGRVAVAYSFYQSLESRMDRVDLLYESLLHRPSDIAGQAYWAGKILASGDVALATNLALSAEYYASAAVRFP
jgi:virginiamycin B lyase